MLATIVILAKEPRPGSVKTRLVPPLSDDEAAALARAFLCDLTRRLATIPDAQVALAIPSEDSPERMARWLGTPVRFLDQGSGDLGARLTRTLDRSLTDGADVAIAVGSDHPNLPRTIVRSAIETARKGNVGWARTDDGGYACIAVPRSLPGLFRDVPWSTADVADVTRNNADRMGVSLVDHGPWYDVDTAADLDRLVRDPATAWRCPDTLQAVRSLQPP
ncbi:MAG: hypothetical protein DHS20C21_04550 [Gemmatimonadota bacterium]|nr:MAG: hypothetical protein DHS20C21_04550 [Gemmatimonadota bacterium]